MSELEKRLEKKRRMYQTALRMAKEATTELGQNAARTNAHDLNNEIQCLEMYISDADRLARGEEISLVVSGTYYTWVETAEEIWDLVFDHALQVKNEIEADMEKVFA